MKSFAFIYLVFACSTSWGQHKTALAAYENVYDLNHELKPSKCDCDFRRKALVLYSDSTFMLEESKGRLDKEVRLNETGTWKVKNDSVLVLNVQEVSNIFQKNKQQFFTKTFIIAKDGIRPYPDDELWKGLSPALRKLKNTR